MRTYLAVLAPVLLASCASAPALTVVRVGKTVANVEGSTDRVSMHRPPTDANLAGVREGAFVVRSDEDWDHIWKDATHPGFPKSVTAGREMMVVVASDDANVSKIKVRRAVENGQLMTVFVRQTILGENCIRKPEERVGYDAVVIPSTAKPVKIFIEDEDDASCGGLPKAQIGCHVPSAPSPATKLAATTGEVAECELTANIEGKYALVDQQLTLVELPPGSNAKLAFPKGPNRATFTLDSFGTYVLHAEATDEAGRKGKSTAQIDVVPKKTKDVLVQVTWSDLALADGSEPRVVLRVAQEGSRGQRCSAEVPVPGLCEAKTRGPFTSMKIPASKRSLGLSLLYLDERAKGGPSPCVNVWFDGERTASTCDDEARKAEDRWELGTLETATGKLTPKAPPPPPAAAPAPPPGKDAAPAPPAKDAAAPSSPPAPPPAAPAK